MADHFHYTYDYRKPRPGNRTYQSYNAYESLYHMGKIEPLPYGSNFMGGHYSSRVQRYTPTNPSPYTQNIAQQPREQKVHYAEPSRKEVGGGQVRYQNSGVNTERQSNKESENRSVKSRSSSMSVNNNMNNNSVPPQERNSILSTYGSNSLPRNKSNVQDYYRPKETEINVFRPQMHQTATVYNRQQRPFDIINLYQKPPQPLRKFHNLTKQHILLQRGMDFPS